MSTPRPSRLILCESMAPGGIGRNDAKGKQKRLYRHYQTPWETFQKLPKAAQYLKPGQTIEALERLAKVESDTAATRQMQQAKSKLFASFVGAKTPR